jgi:hypothetical protein
MVQDVRDLSITAKKCGTVHAGLTAKTKETIGSYSSERRYKQHGPCTAAMNLADCLLCRLEASS